MASELGCLDCGIATIRASARNKQPHTAATRAGKHLFLNVLYAVSPYGLTHATMFPNYLLIVDTYLRHSKIYGLAHKSSSYVIGALKKFQADYSFLHELGHLKTEKIRAESGGEFDSSLFTEHCIKEGIKPVLAAPKKQCQNHLAERTWQTILSIACSLLVHACLPDTFWYQALCYATNIFNVLPIRGLKSQAEIPATPHELFFGSKPFILPFRVFGCPSIVKRWTADERANGKQTEWGIRGIFIGFDTNKKGYLFYMPGSRNILASADAIFDESFHSAIATTWQQHRDTLALQPTHSYIPDVTTIQEQTGTINDNSVNVEEGEINDSKAEEAIVEEGEDEPEVYNNMSNAEERFETAAVNPNENQIDDPHENQIDAFMEHLHEGSLIVDSRNNNENAGPRQSKRAPKPNRKYATDNINTEKKIRAHVAEAVGWANVCTDLNLVEACAVEAHLDIQPVTGDANSWEPVPKTVQDILKMEDGIVRQEWLKALNKELKTLIDAGTFVHDKLK